jgi:hypothetical protein
MPWNDPLDELIADLERAVPAAARPEWDMPPPMEDYCLFGEWLFFARDPAKKAQLGEDPRVRRVQAYYDRWAANLSRADGSPTPGGG